MTKHKQQKIITVGDPNAKAMWGRCRSQVYQDKTKYNRKKNKPIKIDDYIDS